MTKGTKHVVGFSGGIDSEATALYCINRYADDVILMNSEAGRNESPVTVAFVDEFSRTIHHVEQVVPKVKDLWKTEGWAESKGLDGEAELTFTKLIAIKKRPPSRTNQFCTLFLKLVPQKRWIDEHFGPGGKYEGWDYERYTGVRRDESASRRSQLFVEWDRFFDAPLHAPIADWTKGMCFEYVKAAGWPINPLYSLGFGRVGCAPCINSGKDDILLWLHRQPEMIDKIRQSERETGITFFPPVVPQVANNTIDDVIEWAQTSRGGRQFDMLRVLNERPACESKYGLCE